MLVRERQSTSLFDECKIASNLQRYIALICCVHNLRIENCLDLQSIRSELVIVS